MIDRINEIWDSIFKPANPEKVRARALTQAQLDLLEAQHLAESHQFQAIAYREQSEMLKDRINRLRVEPL